MALVLLACAPAVLRGQDEGEQPPAETNVAFFRHGSQIEGGGQPFNPLYDAPNAIDGERTVALFGSAPHGLAGGAVTVTLALPTQISGVALTQAGRAGQFDRARQVEVAVDGRILTTLELADAPQQRQQFPMEAFGQEVRLTVRSQYDAADIDVGGWEEVEVLSREDLAAKFAPPATVAPLGAPLVQATAEAPEVIGRPVTAVGHPRTLWTAAELALLRERLPEDREAKTALDDLVRRMDALLLEKPTVPPPSEAPDATSDLAHRANADAVLNLALAESLTGNKAYGDRAAAILQVYADTLASYPLFGRPDDGQSRLFDRREEMAGWLARMALGYDLLAPGMPSRQRRKIGAAVLRDSAVCLAGPAKLWARSDDTRVSVTAAVLSAGYALDDEELVGWGLDGRDGHGGAPQIIEGDIQEDGRWLTDPVTTLDPSAEPLVLLAECAWRNGVDLYGHAGGRLQRLLDAPLEMAYPTLEIPALYRASRATLLGPRLVLYEYARHRYADAEYRLLAAHLTPYMGTRADLMLPWPWTDGEPPSPVQPERHGHDNLEASGLAVMRVGRGMERNQLVVAYGSEGSPGRVDGLGFDLFGLGRPLMPSPGGTYLDLEQYRSWYRTTVAHNTLTVDERRQVPCRAEVTVFGATEDVGLLRARTDKAYPGVTMDRTLLLTRDYALDLLAAFSRAPRTMDLVYHGFGDLATSLATEPQRYPISVQPGYFQMTHVAHASATENWQAVWTDASGGGPSLVMTVPGDGRTEVVTAGGWMGNRGVPMVIERRKTAETAFAAAINLHRDPVFVSSVSWIDTGTPSARAVQVETRRGTDYLLVSYAPGMRRAGPVQSDARVTFVRTRKHLPPGPWQGDLESIYMAGGSAVDAMGNRLLSSRPALVAAERQGLGVLLLRNLAGETTVVRAEGLDLKPGRREGEEPYVSHAIDAFGSPPEGKVRYGSIDDPIQERLSPGEGIAVRQPGDTFFADRVAGQLLRRRIALQQIQAARLAALDQALMSEAEADDSPVAPGTVIVLEAEDFTGQGGGQVTVTDRKIAARGDKAFLNWDEEGHWLEWTVDVPETGFYQMLVKCCSRDRFARRRLEIDGRVPVAAAADFYLPYTGGWASRKDDWRLVRLEDYRIGRPMLLYLRTGRHALRLTNLGQAANLDYIVIASPDVAADRAEFE